MKLIRLTVSINGTFNVVVTNNIGKVIELLPRLVEAINNGASVTIKPCYSTCLLPLLNHAALRLN